MRETPTGPEDVYTLIINAIIVRELVGIHAVLVGVTTVGYRPIRHAYSRHHGIVRSALRHNTRVGEVGTRIERIATTRVRHVDAFFCVGMTTTGHASVTVVSAVDWDVSRGRPPDPNRDDQTALGRVGKVIDDALRVIPIRRTLRSVSRIDAQRIHERRGRGRDFHHRLVVALLSVHAARRVIVDQRMSSVQQTVVVCDANLVVDLEAGTVAVHLDVRTERAAIEVITIAQVAEGVRHGIRETSRTGKLTVLLVGTGVVDVLTLFHVISDTVFTRAIHHRGHMTISVKTRVRGRTRRSVVRDAFMRRRVAHEAQAWIRETPRMTVIQRQTAVEVAPRLTVPQ